jgi:protease-4
MSARRLLVLSSVLSLLPTAAVAAEPLPARAERIFAPGRSAASDDSADALVLNPANVAFIPGAEARWMGVRCSDTQKVACGHVIEAATPVIFGLATGFRVDYVTPPATTAFIGRSDYAWFTWGLAYKLSDAIAFGGTLQYAYSPNPVTNGLTGVSLGLSVRPSPFLGVSLVAHDINRPAGDPLPVSGLPVLDRSWVISGALRPTGRRGFEIALDLRYLEGANGMGNDQWIPRASVGIDIPHVGRVRGDLEIAHVPNDQRRGVVGTVGLEVGLGNVRVGGGAAFGSGLGSADSVAEFLSGSITSNMNAPALPRPSRAVSIRIESTPGSRAHVHLLQKLWRLSEEQHVAAVTLILRAEPAASLAHAEEIADAIRVLRARGKKVICSYEVNGAPSMYVCASADRTVINPSGFVRYSGLKSTYFYLGGLLKKIGIKAEIVRVSDHKTAGEMFTNEAASDTARADHEDMLREREAVFVRNLALYRHMSEARVREVTAKGPYTAGEARDAGFIDATAFDDELEKVTRDVVGRDVALKKLEDETVTPETFGQREGVALLYLDGDMVDGRSQKIPIIDLKLVGSYTMAETIKQLRDDMHTKAVVLRIESGGGSSICADVIWRELVLLAKKKPLIVSMGAAAASGGYYVAAPAQKIFALPLTVTGSIGVFMGKADLSGLLGKLGVGVETYRTTPRADGESLFRPYTPEERKELEHKVGQIYDVFLDRVAQGRHMTKEEVDAVGQGRVWTGQQALERKLVDKLGGLREALDEARKAAGLQSDAPIAEYPIITPTLFERALDLAGISHAQAFNIAGLPVQVKDMVRAVAPLAIYAKDTSLARIEWVPLEDETGSDE